MKQDTNFYCVKKDEVWNYVKKVNELLLPDEDGRSILASSDRHYCIGMMRVLDYIISNGDSTMDLEHIKPKVKK